VCESGFAFGGGYSGLTFNSSKVSNSRHEEKTRLAIAIDRAIRRSISTNLQKQPQDTFDSRTLL
jgi:hypothetical protein